MEGITAILLFFITVIIALLGGLGLTALKILKGSPSRAAGVSPADEARMIQDIYHGLQKMEQRLEALETIVLDRSEQGGTRK